MSNPLIGYSVKEIYDALQAAKLVTADETDETMQSLVDHMEARRVQAQRDEAQMIRQQADAAEAKLSTAQKSILDGMVAP